MKSKKLRVIVSALLLTAMVVTFGALGWHVAPAIARSPLPGPIAMSLILAWLATVFVVSYWAGGKAMKWIDQEPEP